MNMLRPALPFRENDQIGIDFHPCPRGKWPPVDGKIANANRRLLVFLARQFIARARRGREIKFGAAIVAESFEDGSNREHFANADRLYPNSPYFRMLGRDATDRAEPLPKMTAVSNNMPPRLSF